MKNKIFLHCGAGGKLVMMIGVLLAVPIAVLPFYPAEIKYAPSFLIPSLISVALGIMMCMLSKRRSGSEAARSGGRTVLLIWLYSFFAGAFPFFISGQLDYVRAFFEAVSGWTATGLTVIDVEATPHIFHFYRGFMQFCGGLGFVMVMVMFMGGKQSMSLYSAEGHTDKLMPNLKKTAQTIIVIYLVLLVVGTVGYIIMGMPPFDGLIHAMCALATGGFSTQADNIGAYGSFAIEAWTVILMIIGTINFAVLLLLVKRKFKRAGRVSEIRFMSVLLIVFITVTALSLFYGVYMSVGESIRAALFNIVSALTTAGFSTASYETWPPFVIGVLILLMIIGGGLGSTAGGIKLTRVYLLMRVTGENIRRRFLPPRKIISLNYYGAQGKTPIDDNLKANVIGFASCYIFIFIVGSLLMTLTADCSLSDAMFEFASALGTVGLSIGLTGPETGTATLIVEIIGMILGRLEIFIVLIGIGSGASLIKRGIQKKFAKKAA
ncbi:MAG: TrkH family potassium uptake protein [Clostridiales bacterium]|jgi:trk system potassium uptake protein TrkH|nr:TrkH family potassium uptake protein [Clostridiales bacterium]